MPFQNHIKPLALNDRLVNRAAWRWLKEVRVRPDPYSLHLLTLAQWGLDDGAQGGWPAREKFALEEQLNLLFGWKPENVLAWLFNNPNGPDDPQEQEDSLLTWLKTASSPLSAAAGVLDDIWSRQQADCPALR
jgi:hypothetical protein